MNNNNNNIVAAADANNYKYLCISPKINYSVSIRKSSLRENDAV